MIAHHPCLCSAHTIGVGFSSFKSSPRETLFDIFQLINKVFSLDVKVSSHLYFFYLHNQYSRLHHVHVQNHHIQIFFYMLNQRNRFQCNDLISKYRSILINMPSDSKPAGKTNIPISIGSARSSPNASIVDCFNLFVGLIVNVAIVYVFSLYIFATVSILYLFIYSILSSSKGKLDGKKLMKKTIKHNIMQEEEGVERKIIFLCLYIQYIIICVYVRTF